MEQKYTLENSLNLYETYLRNKLKDEKVLERFLQLAHASRLGCYCTPDNACHTDIIIKVLRENLPQSKLPERCCLKVKYLRPKWDNLREWNSTSGNIMCTRQGRVWITDKKTSTKEIYHYPRSEWANPYKV